MKTTTLKLFLFLIITALVSCSNDDDGGSNTVIDNNFFISVQFEDESFIQERPDIDFLLPWCNIFENFSDEEMLQQGLNPLLNGDLNTTNVGQIETSEYFINVTMSYFETDDSFNAFIEYIEDSNNFNWDDAAFISSSDYLDFHDCLFNNFFIVDFEIGNNALNIATPASLQEMSFLPPEVVNETSTEITYALSGEFSLDFINTDDTTLTLNGQFRFPVYVLK